MKRKYNTRKAGAVAMKHKEVLKNIGKRGADGKPMTLTKAAIKAGYKKSYVESGGLTSSKSWEEQLEEALPDDLLLKVHKEGLKAKRIIHATHEGEITDIQEVVDKVTRHKYLEAGYKLKKRYEETFNIKTKIGVLSDEELEGRISGIVSGIIGAIAGAGKKKK